MEIIERSELECNKIRMIEYEDIADIFNLTNPKNVYIITYHAYINSSSS